MSKRRASHAGSWYSSRRADLSAQLQSWMDQADVSCGGARAIIAPHAGYSYSGPTAAWAYRHINPEGVRRVFVLGPSHHVHLAGCALTRCIAYQTPLGELPIDQPLCAELLATGDFETMDLSVDEEEHSIEMHLPYIQQVMGDQPFTLVPILVGALSQASQSRYGEILAPFLGNAQNLIIISSDFCHWGKRFRFTHRDNACQYIYQSIEALDRQGMELIEKQASLTLPWCPYATPHFSYMPHPTFPIWHRFLVFFGRMRMDSVGINTSSRIPFVGNSPSRCSSKRSSAPTSRESTRSDSSSTTSPIRWSKLQDRPSRTRVLLSGATTTAICSRR